MTRRPAALLAKMTIQFGPITQSYTSRVVADPQALTITAKAVDGPFAYLDSKWTFTPEGQGTRVRFDIDFKMSNPLIAAVAEPAFAAKQDEIIDAFADEADRRFGPDQPLAKSSATIQIDSPRSNFTAMTCADLRAIRTNRRDLDREPFARIGHVA